MTDINETSASTAALDLKLARVSKGLKRVAKDGKMNGPAQYDFVKESDVKDYVREALAAENCYVSSSAVLGTEKLEHVQTSTGKPAFAASLWVRVTIVDGDSSEWRAGYAYGFAVDNSDKCFNKAQTAGTKYGTINLLMLSTGD